MSKNNRASVTKENFAAKRACVLYVLVTIIWPVIVNCITSVENVMENITSVSAHLNLRHQKLLIFPVKRIPSKQRLIIFPAIKTLFYYKPLWPQQQTYLENYTQKHFYYLAVGAKELIFPQSYEKN